MRSITHSTKGDRLGDLQPFNYPARRGRPGSSGYKCLGVAFVSRNGGVYQATADRTDSEGSASLRIVRAASDSSDTRVEGVTAEGLIWDGVMPANEFSK